MKKLYVFVLIVLIFSLVSCGSKTSDTVKIGATAVPHAEILNHLMEDFEAEGLKVEIVEYSDYVKPNLDLDSGDIYANFFQHKQYLDAFNTEHGTDIVSAGGVHIEPLGLYSNKIKSLDELKDGDEITIPNDATNGARALMLLSKNGVIKLKDENNTLATELDIVENPKNLKFTPIDAAQLPRTLEDVSASVINTNYALEADIDPKSSIIKESSDSPYVNILCVSGDNLDSETTKKLIKVLNSDKCKKFIEENYKGAVVPAF